MVRDFSQKTVQELYETIRVNVDEEEQWKVFDFVEDFFMEELEIGDYINDINSYHLHMFDKHDVTTKKFDAIVEKAGKVDANYAAQIEGYCSLLGEYGKKFEAVCAMLQPEKLRLSPDKYREKLEGINTGYQNAKDTHEQEQSAYEAELYEIETVWYKKMLDKAEDYLIRSAECVVLGNFTDEVTVLGVGVQIVLGIFDLDLPCDIRDIIADIKNLAETDRVRWDLIGMLALDLIGLIPVIGALKYSDEIGTLFKNADKVSVVARSTDGAGVLAKHADEAGAWLQGVKVFRYSDETAEAVASGEKLLKESGTIYESFADMMSPDDAAKYLDFLENGSKEGLTSAELAGVEKADALLVSQKVGYEDVWDLRNVGDALESGNYSSLRELMLPEEVARYDEHWLDVAEKISNEALDNQIDFIKNGGITKPGGGAYKPAKISAAVDLNTGDIYFGYNGANKFNPSIQEIHPDLQQRINRTMSLAGNSIDNEYASRMSFEKWSVDNCAEIYSVNNALQNQATLDNIFINTKYFKDGKYALPCRNCQVTFEGCLFPKQ
mgnify:CR=1 FL=1